MRAVAAQDARYAPESIGHHAHFFDARGGTRVKGCSSSHDMLGMTSVPSAPGVAWSAAISPARAALHRFDLRKAQWTTAARRPAARPGRGVGRSKVGETGWAGMRESITAPTRVGIAVGAKRRAFKKVESPVAQSGKSHPLPPSSAKIVRRKGEYFFGVSSGSAAVETPNPEKRKRLCEIVAQNAHRCPIPLE